MRALLQPSAGRERRQAGGYPVSEATPIPTKQDFGYYPSLMAVPMTRCPYSRTAGSKPITAYYTRNDLIIGRT